MKGELMANNFNPIVLRTIDGMVQVHGLLDYTEAEKLDSRAIDISGLISADVDNVVKLGTDGKLFSLGAGAFECTFNIEDLVSSEAGNMSRPSLEDGLLYTDSCEFNSATFVSVDADNSIKFGSDGLLYVYGGDECEINISNLISSDAGNAITISIDDGKLYAISSASCTYNIIDFISTDADNEIVVGGDGKMLVRNLVCEWPIVDMISAISNNRLKAHVAGDGKLYVIPKDLVSSSVPNALTIDGSDNLLRVNPDSLISGDTGGGVSTGTDNKLVVDFGAYWLNLYRAGNFKLLHTNILPAGGTWAYISFRSYYDADLPEYDYLQGIADVGVAAGGTIIREYWTGAKVYDPWARTIAWRVQ